MFIKLLLSLIFIALSLNAKDKVILGILYGKVHFTEKEARIGAKLWVKNMKKTNLDAELEMAFYDNEAKILKDYKDKKISTIVTTGSFFFENKEFFEKYSEHTWILSRNDNKFIQYYLIKNKKSDFDLTNPTNIEVVYKNDLEKFWVESLLLNNKKIKYLRKDREKSMLFEVFFNPKKIAVIPKELYETMAGLNPKFKKNTQIIKKSEKIFFRAIGVTRKDLDKKLQNLYIDITDKVNSNEADFSVLSYVQVQKIFVLENGELDKISKFYDDYIRNKK